VSIALYFFASSFWLSIQTGIDHPNSPILSGKFKILLRKCMSNSILKSTFQLCENYAGHQTQFKPRLFFYREYKIWPEK
jgi:hypothetical protein